MNYIVTRSLKYFLKITSVTEIVLPLEILIIDLHGFHAKQKALFHIIIITRFAETVKWFTILVLNMFRFISNSSTNTPPLIIKRVTPWPVVRPWPTTH